MDIHVQVRCIQFLHSYSKLPSTMYMNIYFTCKTFHFREILNVLFIVLHYNASSASFDDTMGLQIHPSLITEEGYNTSPYCKLFS